MSKQTINVGSGELVGDGEGIRTAFIKINSNFNELYSNTSTGYTGSASTGTTGYTGSQGNVGYTGSASTGTTGYTGSQGNVGYTGSASTGTTGYTGSQGNVGYTGSKGDPGTAGTSGNVQRAVLQATNSGPDTWSFINIEGNLSTFYTTDSTPYNGAAANALVITLNDFTSLPSIIRYTQDFGGNPTELFNVNTLPTVYGSGSTLGITSKENILSNFNTGTHKLWFNASGLPPSTGTLYFEFISINS